VGARWPKEEEKIMKRHSEEDRALWDAVLKSEAAFISARGAFIAQAQDRVGVIVEGLKSRPQREIALGVLALMMRSEKHAVLDSLVRLSSVGHREITFCREAILSMPRKWVVANIEESAEPLLQGGNHEEYRRLLELFIELDRELTRKLALRALQSKDADIREAGMDFIEALENE
jgi:hypothetical protein